MIGSFFFTFGSLFNYLLYLQVSISCRFVQIWNFSQKLLIMFAYINQSGEKWKLWKKATIITQPNPWLLYKWGIKTTRLTEVFLHLVKTKTKNAHAVWQKKKMHMPKEYMSTRSLYSSTQSCLNMHRLWIEEWEKNRWSADMQENCIWNTIQTFGDVHPFFLNQ